ncbi:hypothetical protein NW759_016824 [Fusarium solani]|nr:hypothetical protein NW759_016824 [Fusarium solani]
MPPPSPTESFATWEEAFEYVQSHAKRHHYAMVKKRSANYKNGVPRRHDFQCACSGTHVERSSGLRYTVSRKTDCPFKLKIVQLGEFEGRWFIDIMYSEHNHMSDHPSAFPEHRNITEDEREEIRLQTDETNFTARAILLSLRAKNPETLITEQDICNVQASFREEELGSLMSTQALVKTLKERGYWSAASFDKEERLKYLLVVVDREFELWRQFNHIMMFDGTYNTDRYGLKLIQVNERTKKLFPNTQMQLCIWHICTNVLKAVNERWIGEKEQQNLPFDDWHALSKKPASDAHPRGKQVTQKDFLRSWKLVMYAKTTEDLRARWRDFRT